MTKINRFSVPEGMYEKQIDHFLQNDAQFDQKSYEVFHWPTKGDKQMDGRTHTTLCAHLRFVKYCFNF